MKPVQYLVLVESSFVKDCLTGKETGRVVFRRMSPSFEISADSFEFVLDSETTVSLMDFADGRLDEDSSPASRAQAVPSLEEEYEEEEEGDEEDEVVADEENDEDEEDDLPSYVPREKRTKVRKPALVPPTFTRGVKEL
jgi:hypothetical protein